MAAMADHGGMMRETFAMAKAYGEARKATADEVDDYRRFILTLARRVAERHEEHGTQISAAERAALDDLATALGASPG